GLAATPGPSRATSRWTRKRSRVPTRSCTSPTRPPWTRPGRSAADRFRPVDAPVAAGSPGRVRRAGEPAGRVGEDVADLGGDGAPQRGDQTGLLRRGWARGRIRSGQVGQLVAVPGAPVVAVGPGPDREVERVPVRVE